MDAVDLEVWVLKASALASSVAAGDVHEGVVEVARWMLKTYDGVAAVREGLRCNSARIDKTEKELFGTMRERDDYKQRHANQVKANEEDWMVFKSIAVALGMDSFRLVDLVATAEAAKRVLEAARGVIVCTPTTVPLMDAIDAYDKLTGRKP